MEQNSLVVHTMEEQAGLLKRQLMAKLRSLSFKSKARPQHAKTIQRIGSQGSVLSIQSSRSGSLNPGLGKLSASSSRLAFEPLAKTPPISPPSPGGVFQYRSDAIPTDAGAFLSQEPTSDGLNQVDSNGEEEPSSFPLSEGMSSEPSEIEAMDALFLPPVTPGIRSAVIDMSTPRPNQSEPPSSDSTSNSSSSPPVVPRLRRRTTFQDQASEIASVMQASPEESNRVPDEQESLTELKEKVGVI